MAKDRRSSARAPSSESTAVTSKPFSVREGAEGLAPMGFALDDEHGGSCVAQSHSSIREEW